MPRFNLLLACVLCASVWGCNNEPGPIQRAASASKPPAEVDKPPPQDEPLIDEGDQVMDGESLDSAGSEEAAADKPEAHELVLKESGITFDVPADWKRVPPQNGIIEAEFELAHVEGDEFDGRLTLMSAGGTLDEAIAIRTAEFKFAPGDVPGRETISIGGLEATLVDLRGEWTGISIRQSPPRPDYRMLLAILPFSKQSAFYAKLTGPRATVAAHETAFREFLRTAQITR
ncbi:MAG TPA: hypothetical protein VKU82_11585 [Planctomycetaceae bacterium]|nr:hypothetical protein [Planctomycetaceae bacterium]